MKKFPVIYDPIFKKHETGFGHPESPLRLDAIMKAAKELSCSIISPRMASEEDILLCHTKQYYELVKQEVLEGRNCLSTGDAMISRDSFEAAIYAVGAVLTGVDLICEGKEKTIFCAVRPPGHHACSDKGMGFCLFNNVAIGARYAQKKYGIKRVLIVDWDVHHGNGTQEIFYADKSIFYFSTHQLGNYPGTGAEDEIGTAGTMLNCPLLPGAYSREEIFKAFRVKLLSAMSNFKPEFVMISAGFDAHERDPLGGFNLTSEDFGELTQIVKEIAEKYAKGRILSVLEGGYDLQGLYEGVFEHLSRLS